MRQDTYSPKWSSITKLVVAFSLIAIAAFLLIQFKVYLGPLLLAFIIAYLFNPIADRFQKWTKAPWRLSVGVVFIVAVLLLLATLAGGGIAVVDQAQNLVTFLQNAFVNVNAFINDLPNRTISIGSFVYPLSELNLGITDLANQILSVVQPVFSSVGTVLGTIASSAASLIWQTIFILLIAYFVLSETGGGSASIFHFNIPGFQSDVERMKKELSRVWNAFARGQIFLILLTVVIYSIFLGGMGLRFFFGLAILAGLARFVPYIGPAVAWTAYFLVSIFQANTPFNLLPIVYALIIVGVSLVIDNIIDTFITPRIMGNALKVHPAVVMVGALIGARILGLVGVLLAAPVMATFILFGRYAVRKLFDLDPWEGMAENEAINVPSLKDIHLGQMYEKVKNLLNKIHFFNKNKKEKESKDEQTTT